MHAIWQRMHPGAVGGQRLEGKIVIGTVACQLG